MKVTQVKWEEIKLDYLAGIKPKELVEKYKVDYSTLTNRVSKEGWSELLRGKIAKFNKLYVENQVNSELQSIEEMKAKEREGADLLYKAIENKIASDGEVDSTLTSQDINNLTSSLEKIQKIKYKSYGISDKLDIKAGIELPAVINFTKAE